jgi:hypothetical protein
VWMVSFKRVFNLSCGRVVYIKSYKQSQNRYSKIINIISSKVVSSPIWNYTYGVICFSQITIGYQCLYGLDDFLWLTITYQDTHW